VSEMVMLPFTDFTESATTWKREGKKQVDPIMFVLNMKYPNTVICQINYFAI